MTKIFEQRKNFDLRRLLAGSERLIDHLLTNDSKKRACNKSILSELFAQNQQVTTLIIMCLSFQFRIIHSFF